MNPHTLDSIINPKPQESDLGQQRGAHKLQVANKAHNTASHQASTRATHKTARQQDSLASISSAPGWLLLHLERRHENRRNLRQSENSHENLKREEEAGSPGVLGAAAEPWSTSMLVRSSAASKVRGKQRHEQALTGRFGRTEESCSVSRLCCSLPRESQDRSLGPRLLLVFALGHLLLSSSEP